MAGSKINVAVIIGGGKLEETSPRPSPLHTQDTLGGRGIRLYILGFSLTHAFDPRSSRWRQFGSASEHTEALGDFKRLGPAVEARVRRKNRADRAGKLHISAVGVVTYHQRIEGLHSDSYV